MNRLKALIVIALILFMTGCDDFFMICSLNPFYLDKNVVLNHEIEGKWTANPLLAKTNPTNDKEPPKVWKQTDTISLWKIERSISKETVKTKGGKDSTVYKPLDFYIVKMINRETDSSIYQFKMVLFRVNNMLYADFMPYGNTGLEKSRFATESYFTVHTLARVVVRNKQFVISWLGEESMKNMIEEKRVRVSYQWVESASRLMLNGSSEQLTGLIERYAGEPRFIDWENQQAMLKLNLIK
jgi:hypothetical protein